MMEYCPNGDGQKLLNQHIALNQQQNSCIPEPAIWHIFNSLIKAGLTMERVFVGENDQDNARKLAEVVHLDIKPDNIVFGEYPDTDQELVPDNFAMYPVCKLGDFGLATYRRLAENQRNLKNNLYIGRGAPGYFAPEQKPEYHGRRRPTLNTKTNVWGVGITVIALMNLNVAAGHLEFQQAATDELDPLLVPAFTPTAIAEYSSELRRMVQGCVQYRQHDRPSFTTLLASLRHYTGLAPGYRDRALGARFGTRHALPANNFALGMAMPP
jgi:serine/threonine protein kinase